MVADVEGDVAALDLAFVDHAALHMAVGHTCDLVVQAIVVVGCQKDDWNCLVDTAKVILGRDWRAVALGVDLRAKVDFADNTAVDFIKSVLKHVWVGPRRPVSLQDLETCEIVVL